MINNPGEVVIHKGAHTLLGRGSTPKSGQRNVVIRRQALDIEAISQLLFATKVVIEAADTGSGSLENLIDRRVDHALFEEQRQSSVKERLSFPFGSSCHPESLM